KRSPFFSPERFTYQPEHDRYICPAGQPLNYGGRSHRHHAWTYIGTRKRCGPCTLRPQCTSAAFRCLVIHQHEAARQRARELSPGTISTVNAALFVLLNLLFISSAANAGESKTESRIASVGKKNGS